MQQPRIFVSYSHQDMLWCRALVAVLREQGYDVWYDERLVIGAQWLGGIERELMARTFFLLILSPEAWASDWVQQEYTLAQVKRRTIIPVMHREVQVSGFIELIQMIMAIGEEPVATAQRIIAAIEQHVQAEEAVATVDPLPVVTPSAMASASLPEVTLHTPPTRSHPRLFVWSIVQAEPHRIIAVHAPEMTIGREPDNTLVLHDDSVSHYHARLRQEADGWYIEQQPKAAPVYVNGQATTRAKLATLDQIVLGRMILRLELPTSPATAQQKVPCLVVDCPEFHCIAPLRAPEVSVGRAPDNGLVIPSPLVSQHGAHLTLAAEGVYAIEDTGMRNPLRVHDDPITRHTLYEDDRLTIGSPDGQSTVLIRFITMLL